MSNLTSLRIDKWLWAARFYKTRQLAVKALKNGKIAIAGQTVKPSSNISIGNLVNIKNGPYLLSIQVQQLSEKRGSASVAQTLYTETAASISAREALKKQLAAQPKIQVDRRKPDKRGIRSNRALKRGD